MGQPVIGNVLDNANIPATTTAKVTGFRVAGSSQILAPGSSTTLSSPITGKAIGTLTLQASGAFNFLPVDGYAGAAPAVDVYSSCTNGATAATSLTIDVLLRKPRTAWQPPNCILGAIPLKMYELRAGMAKWCHASSHKRAHAAAAHTTLGITCLTSFSHTEAR
jgi:hypothetical protein